MKLSFIGGFKCATQEERERQRAKSEKQFWPNPVGGSYSEVSSPRFF